MDKNKNKRIAISGAASTGKSTLCDKISMHTGYPIICDFMDIELQKKGYRSFKDVPEPNESMNIRLNALLKKIEKENELDTFISDKCVVDYLAYWIINSSVHAPNHINLEYIEIIEQHLHRYEMIVLPLWGRIPLEKKYRRSNNLFYNWLVHKTIYSILLKYSLPYIVIDQLAFCHYPSLLKIYR